MVCQFKLSRVGEAEVKQIYTLCSWWTLQMSGWFSSDSKNWYHVYKRQIYTASIFWFLFWNPRNCNLRRELRTVTTDLQLPEFHSQRKFRKKLSGHQSSKAWFIIIGQAFNGDNFTCLLQGNTERENYPTWLCLYVGSHGHREPLVYCCSSGLIGNV